jgi:hypothetical protein
MVRSRHLALAALALSASMLGGCLTDSDSAAPTISSALYVSGYAANDTTDTLKASTNYHLAGTVKDVASWSWTIIRSSDGAVVDTLTTDAPNGSGSTDIGSGSAKSVPFTPTSKWGGTGIYYVQGVLTGTDGSSLTTKVKFLAAPGGSSTSSTALTTVSTFNVGGLSTSSSSFIGLATGKAYTGTQTATYYDSVDLVVTADDSGYAIFVSTAKAVSNSWLTSSYWGSGKATLITKVTSAPTTLEEAKAVSLSTQSATIVDGSSYVAKATDGTYYVIKASNVSGSGDNITLTITLLK